MSLAFPFRIITFRHSADSAFCADITEYLESDPDATAVIHCKGGQGQVGDDDVLLPRIAAYLPTAPTSVKNYSKMQRPPAQSVLRRLLWLRSPLLMVDPVRRRRTVI